MVNVFSINFNSLDFNYTARVLGPEIKKKYYYYFFWSIVQIVRISSWYVLPAYLSVR